MKGVLLARVTFIYYFLFLVHLMTREVKVTRYRAGTVGCSSCEKIIAGSSALSRTAANELLTKRPPILSRVVDMFLKAGEGGKYYNMQKRKKCKNYK